MKYLLGNELMSFQCVLLSFYIVVLWNEYFSRAFH